ncbi:SpoIIE family protein phosphatase [Streptomyces chitinivorans]|uniref:SpoIIE family protein phosphatase n=1 Tax=Streptomyces chitinivorans TaxID=1257027 RepID=A0ABW7HZ50_9ACTN|nr:SpoIIE family protein phosphatase [Streptomyces chitinivorans]MDH2411477.1 SpoIIE family protein phosphatase [Streptomyces chitinivorans]
MSFSRRSTESPEPSGLPLEVFDPAPVGVLVCRGPRHVLTYMNAAYRAIFGDRPLGVPVRRAFADLEQRGYLDLFDPVLRDGEPARVSAAPVTVRYAHGEVERRYFSFSVSRIAPAGEEPGVLVVAAEVTAEVTATEHARTLAEERRRTLLRYQSLVATSTEKVWVADPGGLLVEGSDGWERATGRPWEELRGAGWLGTAHPDDRAALAEAWYRAVREVPERFQHTYRLRYADGAYRHCLLRAVPVRDGGGVLEWMAACVDVEEQWWRELRDSLIGRASAAVAESENAPDAFAALSRVIVPALADECGIYLLTESAGQPPGDGRLTVERVAATAREGLPAGLPPRREEHVGPGHLLARAVRERRGVHRSFTPGAVPADVAPPGVRPWLSRTGAHSGVALPVLVDGAVAAVVTAFVCGGRAPIGPQHRSLMREVVEQAHDALSQALRLQRTQRAARALQRSLLTEPPDHPHLRIAARYLPSPAAADVGGDWYDSFPLPGDALALVIGDVAGHDLGAAVTMGRMRNMLRALAADHGRRPPGEVVRRLDAAVQALDPDTGTTTCVMARVERGPKARAEAGGGSAKGPWRLTYTAAGHPPPLLIARDGGARFLEGARGPLLGILPPDAPRDSATEELPPGCTLLLYTDGLVERPGESLDRGLERLRRNAAALAREPVGSLCDGLVATTAATGRDDIALIALRPAAPGR